MKRRILRGVLVLVAAFAVAIVAVGARASHMLTGYKAKMLCSEVMVGGRAVDAVRSDLEVDDLWALRLFPASFDAASHTATASLPFGLRPRRARFHNGGGCTLEFDDQPPTTPAPDTSPPVSANPPAAVAHDAALRQVVDEAFREPDPARPRRTRAVVILRDGQIVAEHYAGGVDARTRLPGWSMTKSALNALVGILVGRGTLSLNAPADVPAWRTAGDPRRAITLDHLLRMSSGLDLDETIAIRRADVMAMLFEAPDMAAFAASAPLRAAPGSRWQYASGSSLIISSIIRRALGDDEYRRFPRSALFDRLGMDGAVIEADASGTFVASSYMYATAREWGRLGTLYLQDGVWEGARVLPEGWVDYTRTPAPADRDRVYGAHFWLTLPEIYNPRWTNLPPGTFHAAGHEGQFVSIVPARGVVVVRLGKTRHGAAWDQAQFVADVLAAMLISPHVTGEDRTGRDQPRREPRIDRHAAAGKDSALSSLMAPPRRHLSMLRSYTPADALTIGNASCGTMSIFLCLDYMAFGDQRRLWIAIALLPAALVCDVLDGYVARLNRTRQSLLGADLDSLADVISFGVAPAVLGFTLGLRGGWDMLFLVYFVVCGVSRLARFNVTTAALTDVSTGKVTHFEGTPIPTSIVLVALLAVALWLGRIDDQVWFGAWRIGPAVLHPLVLLYGLSGSAMISATLRIPKP